MKQAKIEYPRPWEYRIIGTCEEEMRDAAEVILSGKQRKVSVSNKSRNGKYLSLNIETFVLSQADRDKIYTRLSAAPQIKRVL